MSLTNLTNTTWTFKSALNTYPGGAYTPKSYNIDITTSEKISGFSGSDSVEPEDTFVSISIGYNSGSEMNDIFFGSSSDYVVASGHDTKSLPDPWGHVISIPFTITGGTDATNSDLISWFEANADRVLTEIDYVTTSTDLISVADAIRVRAEISEMLEFPSGFITAISNIPSYSVYNGAHHSVVTGYTVTISLTNPVNAYGFGSFSVYRNDTDAFVADITSATGNTTIAVDPSWNGIYVMLSGTAPSVSPSGVSCTGGVSFTGENSMGLYVFAVVGDGTVTFDEIDWDD